MQCQQDPGRDSSDGKTSQFFRTCMNTRKRIIEAETRAALLAPCGMNCRLCRAYGREHNPCPGCRNDDGPKSNACVTCGIKNCRKLAEREMRYCFRCDEFPCLLLDKLDERYRSKYGMSMIENLLNIKNLGIRQFVRSENKRWHCRQCGEMLCVHKPQCQSCGTTWSKRTDNFCSSKNNDKR